MESGLKIIVLREKTWSVGVAASTVKEDGSIDYVLNGRVETALKYSWKEVGRRWNDETIEKVVIEHNIDSIKRKPQPPPLNFVVDDYELFENDCGCEDCRRARLRRNLR